MDEMTNAQYYLMVVTALGAALLEACRIGAEQDGTTFDPATLPKASKVDLHQEPDDVLGANLVFEDGAVIHVRVEDVQFEFGILDGEGAGDVVSPH